MRKNKKWSSGLLAAAASLLLLTGCGEGYYGEGLFEYSDASATVWEDEGQIQSHREGDAQDAEFSGESETASEETWDGWEDSPADTGSFRDDRKPSGENQNDPAGPGAELDEYGVYTSMEDVALYLYTYEELPDNFITKKEARALGWEGGSLEPYAPGMCIGGDYFGNYEGNLPEEEGREYHECDIDTLGARSRGAKRIVYSNDGLIYYTEDHYETFTLLYGDE